MKSSLFGLLGGRAESVSCDQHQQKSGSSLSLPEHSLILSYTHRSKLLRPIVLIEDVIGVFPQLLHVSSNEHLTKLDEIAVRFVVNFNHTPWISPSPCLTTVGEVDQVIRTDYGEGNFALTSYQSFLADEGRMTHDNLLVLLDSLLILILVSGRLEDPDTMMSDVRQNLRGVSLVAKWEISTKLTLCLNKVISSSVRVSALAMTGMRLTLVCNRRMNSISIGLRL